MTRDRRLAERRGRRAETIAAWWMRLHGWQILARRKRLWMIEVDIIARRGDVLALVEVKQRATIDAAIAAVSPDALRRLSRAAHQLATEANARGERLSARVDLVALVPRGLPRHIPQIG